MKDFNKIKCLIFVFTYQLYTMIVHLEKLNNQWSILIE